MAAFGSDRQPTLGALASLPRRTALPTANLIRTLGSQGHAVQ